MAYTYQNFASLGVNLNRQKYGALDISSVFTSEADLKYYLSKGTEKTGVSQYWLDVVPYPYAGQVLATVIDDVVNVYVLKEKADGTFETDEVGGKVTADEVSITVSEAGVIGLAGFAAAKSGSRLVKTENGVSWEEPSTITVEGLSDSIAALRADMTAAQNDIDALEEKVGTADDAADASGSLFARVAQNAADIVTINGKLTGVFHFKGAAPEGQLAKVESPEVGDVYTVGDKEWAYDGSDWVELGFTTDLSAYSTTEQMNGAISTAKGEANTYADGVAAQALTDAKAYTDELGNTLNTQIAAAKTKLGAIPDEKTVKEYIDEADAATLAAAKADAQAKVEALGALAAKDEVAESDLAAALKSKIDGKADSATTLAGYGIEDGVTKSELTDTIAGLGTMSKENAADYTKTADLETALAGKYDAAGAASAVQGVTTETVASVDAKAVANAADIATLKGTGVGSVTKTVDDKIAALDLANTYASKAHAHTTSDVSGLDDKLSALETADSNLDKRIGTLKIGETTYDDVTAYVDAKTAGIATDAQLTNLSNEVATLKSKVDTDGKVSEAIAAGVTEAKGYADGLKTESDNAVAAVDAKIGTVTTGKTVVEMISEAQVAATYDDTQVKADIKANKDAIDVLNGSGVGSVKKSVDDAINEFATNVTDDGVVNSYKELIDWVATHGSEAAEMAAAIDALEAILDGIGGEGEKATVVAYVQDAIDALKIGDYAKAADLTALAGRVAAAEGKLDTLNGTGDGSVAKALADAKSYADGLADNYDAKGSATAAETAAKAYADGLAVNYDAKGSADQALTDAKAYTDAAIAQGMVWGSF